jgi:hypothetical protein
MKARTLQAVAAVRNSERYALRMIPPFYPYDLPSGDIGLYWAKPHCRYDGAHILDRPELYTLYTIHKVVL